MTSGQHGRRFARVVAAASIACAVVLGAARAEEPAATLFSAAIRALKDGRPGDAIASFETLADRGLVDPIASFDRALAYAARVRIGAESPGDLGQAAHGFEEARELTKDPDLARDAARGLTVIRSEVARRRMRSGQPATVDAGRSFGRAVAGLLSEDAWEAISALSSVVLGVGLALRWAATQPALRVGGGLGAAVAVPLLALAAAMTLAARHDRLDLREAIVVTPSARPVDDHGIAIAGSVPLPEGARVEVVDARSAMSRVRFGSDLVWVGESALRPLARR